MSTFLDMLNEATAIVRASYPDAQFYEADLNIDMAGSPWRFVYNIPAEEPGTINTTVIITNTLGKFGEPVHYDQPWLEDRVIPLPIFLDLAEAMRLAESAGCGSGEPKVINLRWALYPGVDEPNYILSYADVRAFVGVWTHKVTCSPLVATGF